MEGAQQDGLIRHWRWLVLLFWIGMAAFLLYQRWAAIGWFALGDTDDNLRIAQVRALIEGQGWYDLRQYRMNPPFGADIHWSRLVDLPIAGIRLALAPLIGGPAAEKTAVALAPLLPMGIAIAAVAVTARRLISPWAFVLALAIFACAGSARAMWAPLRIDHHGWQLAMLMLALMALADPKRARGGATLGIATALSFAIGMEMLVYLAAAGAITVLMWIRDESEARRLGAYGITLAGGTALAFLIFTSEANRAAVCDALSPVWLSAMSLAGAACVVLAWISPADWRARLGLAAAAGLAIAGAFAAAWPHCLGRLEGSSDELERLWLSKVREALPIYRHDARIAVQIVTLPVVGLIGYGAMLWRHRRDGRAFMHWLAPALLALLAAGLLLWQTRAGAAAQLLAIPGATALGLLLIHWFRQEKNLLLRLGGVVGSFLLVSGLIAFYGVRLLPERPVTKGRAAVNAANRSCPTLPALRPIAQQPKGTILTFVDLGPRIIVATPHDTITGPYHRNQQLIIDVMRTWRGDAENARATARRYRVDYLLICPNMSESTVYRAEAPNGFYTQLMRGEVPDWLEPVTLPENSPYRMWRVRR